MTVAPAFMPYGTQTIEADDLAAVSAAMQGPYLTTGPGVTAFEKAFAEAVGASHAVACSNGTAALHLAILGLNIGTGDTVIVPAMTFLATASAAVIAGANVVFADVDPDTGLLTPDTFGEALSRVQGHNVKAVLPVHYGGHTVAMPELSTLAASAGIAVIEDACHAIGGAILDSSGSEHPVGSCHYSTMATFSLHPVKTITTMEGGVVTTSDTALAKRLRLLRNHGMVREPEQFMVPRFGAEDGDNRPGPWVYEMASPGLNYRLTDVQCALGLSQLAKLNRFVTRRATLVARYRERLAPLSPLIKAMPEASGCRPGWHLMVALIDFKTLGKSRSAVMAELRELGVGTQVHYIPVNRQPFYAERGAPRLPGADRFYERQLSLPLYPAMADSDVDRVADALARLIEP